MAVLNDEQISDAFSTHLHPGEKLLLTAMGVKQPNMLYMLPLFALAVIPGVIATQMLTKNYVIGLTDSRFIALQIKNLTNSEVKEVIEYSLEAFRSAPAKVKTGALFTTITIDDVEKPFKAKFARALSKSNRPNAVAIGEALSG